MKILFITPHLSTGGAPQYLLKKIQELKDFCEIYCVEYSNITGGVLVVQRNQIEEILGSKLITLHENKHELINHIQNINPDVIHFEELPEYFCDYAVAKQIYNSNRTYKIIETSHDSSFDIKNKLFFPDSFVFVSEYQKNLFENLKIPSEVVELPISFKQKKDRDKSLLDLGLDPKKTHFLNVGLFTSRKNQSEVIEYAKNLLNENVQFHFVGNQADNFKWYWEPLMKNFPSNCKWWGERKDVDIFYNAMDVFLFTSKGTTHDKETNPLVVREAIGWNLPILMYNLPVYCGMYDIYKNITWLESDFYKNLNKIKKLIKKEDSGFSYELNDDENKIIVNYNGDEELENILISIKDIDSKACIYSFKYKNITPNYSLWIMPLPKSVIDFKNNINFGGFLIQIFSNSKMICELSHRYKTISINKPIIDFSNEEPIFCNYTEFFVEKIYDDFNLKNLDVCFDIGANVGLFTKYLKINNAKTVYCFEPNKKAFEELNNNLKNELSINFYNLAVSSNNNEKVKLYIDNNNSLISSAMNKTDNFYEVDCITINDVINQNNINKIDLVKIDIEGMEFNLIDNLNVETFDKIDRFLIEYHDFYFDNGMQKVEKLIKVLEKNNFLVCRPTQYKFLFAIKNN